MIKFCKDFLKAWVKYLGDWWRYYKSERDRCRSESAEINGPLGNTYTKIMRKQEAQIREIERKRKQVAKQQYINEQKGHPHSYHKWRVMMDAKYRLEESFSDKKIRIESARLSEDVWPGSEKDNEK